MTSNPQCAQSLRPFALASLALASLLTLAPSTEARQWKPDARTQALDYTQIIDTKGGSGEIVVVWWVVPETFMTAPNAGAIMGVLERYVVVGIAHGRAAATGAPTFQNISSLTIADQTARPLQPLAPNAMPAEVAQTITSLQGMAGQSLGPIGQGIRWFVFDGSTIHGCMPGRMSVPYGGETYIFETPIPGCTR